MNSTATLHSEGPVQEVQRLKGLRSKKNADFTGFRSYEGSIFNDTLFAGGAYFHSALLARTLHLSTRDSKTTYPSTELSSMGMSRSKEPTSQRPVYLDGHSLLIQLHLKAAHLKK